MTARTGRSLLTGLAMTMGLVLHAQRAKFAKPPASTAEDLPEGLGWFLVTAAAVVVIWLWSITPRNERTARTRKRT